MSNYTSNLFSFSLKRVAQNNDKKIFTRSGNETISDIKNNTYLVSTKMMAAAGTNGSSTNALAHGVKT